MQSSFAWRDLLKVFVGKIRGTTFVPTVRVVVGGLLAMAVTYGIGALVGTQVG